MISKLCRAIQYVKYKREPYKSNLHKIFIYITDSNSIQTLNNIQIVLQCFIFQLCLMLKRRVNSLEEYNE